MSQPPSMPRPAQQPVTFGGGLVGWWTWPQQAHSSPQAVQANPAATQATLAPCVLMVHDLFGSNHGPNRLFVRLSRVLAEHGVASLRFDLSGHGNSKGDLAQATLPSMLDDLAGACAQARQQPELDPERLMLLGHGFGGLLCGLAAPSALPHRLLLWSPQLPSAHHHLLRGGVLPPTLSEQGGWLLGREWLQGVVAARPLQALQQWGGVCELLCGDQHRPEVEATLAYAKATRANAQAFAGVDGRFAHAEAAEWLLGQSLRFFLGETQ